MCIRDSSETSKKYGLGYYDTPLGKYWVARGDDGGANGGITFQATENCTSSSNKHGPADELIMRLFAQSYGTWAWNDTDKRYEPVSGDWTPPKTACNSTGLAPRPAYPGDFCGIKPIISNIKINGLSSDATFSKNGFANLTFNTAVDGDQLPLVMYAVDWGDGEITTVSGVEMRDRPNPSNPSSLYHLYSYWDLKAKANSGVTRVDCSTAGVCKVQPKIQIKDNWGWCNGPNGNNDCDYWKWFGGQIIVLESGSISYTSSLLATPPSCGDGACNGAETCSTCPGDCGACPVTPPSASCGDGACNGSETCSSCPGDCGACASNPPVSQASCSDGIQNQGETGIDCGGPCSACSDPCRGVNCDPRCKYSCDFGVCPVSSGSSVTWGPQINTPFNGGNSSSGFSWGGSLWCWTTIMGCSGNCSASSPPATTYSWSVGSYGTCNVTCGVSACGYGTKTRTVVCKDNSGATVSDSFCSSAKPDTTTNCTVGSSGCIIGQADCVEEVPDCPGCTTRGIGSCPAGCTNNCCNIYDCGGNGAHPSSWNVVGTIGPGSSCLCGNATGQTYGTYGIIGWKCVMP